MLEQVLKSLQTLPQRLTGTENEKKASEILKNLLEELGYSVRVEGFSSPGTFSWSYLVIYLGFFLGLILAIFYPIWGGAIFLISPSGSNCSVYFSLVSLYKLSIMVVFPDSAQPQYTILARNLWDEFSFCIVDLTLI